LAPFLFHSMEIIDPVTLPSWFYLKNTMPAVAI